MIAIPAKAVLSHGTELVKHRATMWDKMCSLCNMSLLSGWIARRWKFHGWNAITTPPGVDFMRIPVPKHLISPTFSMGDLETIRFKKAPYFSSRGSSLDCCLKRWGAVNR